MRYVNVYLYCNRVDMSKSVGLSVALLVVVPLYALMDDFWLWGCPDLCVLVCPSMHLCCHMHSWLTIMTIDGLISVQIPCSLSPQSFCPMFAGVTVSNLGQQMNIRSFRILNPEASSVRARQSNRSECTLSETPSTASNLSYCILT